MGDAPFCSVISASLIHAIHFTISIYQLFCAKCRISGEGSCAWRIVGDIRRHLCGLSYKKQSLCSFTCAFFSTSFELYHEQSVLASVFKAP